jgi:cyclophilin family peptidyl-prolyl cis-trans isomerase
MSRRRRRHKAGPTRTRASAPPPGPAARRSSGWWGLAIVGLALGVGLWLWLSGGRGADKRRPAARETADASTTRLKKQDTSPAGKKEAPSFLDAFGGKGGSDKEPAGAVLTDAELENRYQALLDLQDRARAREKRIKNWKRRPSLEEFKAALVERDQLEAQLNKESDSFQKELVRAREARPKAAVPQWLSGELLMRVGGEPDEVLPYLRRAVALGLSRPRLFASLAHAETEANQLDKAYQSASKALELDDKDRYVWEKFGRVAFAIERFAEVSARLQNAFPGKLPEWAEPMQKEAASQQALWLIEQKRRAADAKANLPRVRLVIAHRRFAREGKSATSRIETTGREEVIVELFKDQAPQAVAHFLSLVEKKVYDGARFYFAEPVGLAAAGDPDWKAVDPASAAKAGSDERSRPDARGFFRGTLGLVLAGPRAVPSPFFVTFAPRPQMSAHYTAIGRVIQGQDAVERITLGRVSRDVGHFGTIIPGDLLVRAEVVRK